MGLNERRKIQEYQETIIPDRLKELEEICECTVPYEIDWESFANDLPGLNYLDNLSFHRINMAFRVLCSDSLGKEAVKESLKLIRLKNAPSKDDMSISFKDGILEMHCAYALGTNGMYTDSEIKTLLEKSL